VLAADSDHHPNPDGHRLIARRVYLELTKSPELLSTGIKADVPRPSAPAGSAPDLAQKQWRLETHQGSVATLEHSSTEPGRMRVSISALPKRIPSSVKLQEIGFQISGGDRYVLSFRARSDAPRSIACAA